MVEERESLAAALIEREQDVKSHDLVLEALGAAAPDRRAWQLVGDVLVERTVAEVLPATAANRDSLAALSANLKGQLETKGKEVLAFQARHNIRFKGEGGGGAPAAPAAAAAPALGGVAGGGQGVLVK
jgi:prefoldin subunit 2